MTRPTFIAHPQSPLRRWWQATSYREVSQTNQQRRSVLSHLSARLGKHGSICVLKDILDQNSAFSLYNSLNYSLKCQQLNLNVISLCPAQYIRNQEKGEAFKSPCSSLRILLACCLITIFFALHRTRLSLSILMALRTQWHDKPFQKVVRDLYPGQTG